MDKLHYIKKLKDQLPIASSSLPHPNRTGFERQVIAGKEVIGLLLQERVMYIKHRGPQ